MPFSIPPLYLANKIRTSNLSGIQRAQLLSNLLWMRISTYTLLGVGTICSEKDNTTNYYELFNYRLDN